MLPQTLATIDEKFLKQVCEDQWPESQTLEFKAVLPNKDEEGSQEFRKDVCALANADGGDLVFGISEKDGKANSILPITSVQVDATKRRLLQILESNVEPRIQGMQTHDCSLASGGFVLVPPMVKTFTPRYSETVVLKLSKTSYMTENQGRNPPGSSANGSANGYKTD